jgi:hypothetical protein
VGESLVSRQCLASRLSREGCRTLRSALTRRCWMVENTACLARSLPCFSASTRSAARACDTNADQLIS